MSGGGDYCPGNEYCVTYGTVGAFSEARFCTGCGCGRVGDNGVARSGDYFLSDKYGIAYGAMRTFGAACFGAGCGYCRVGDEGVAGGGNNDVGFFKPRGGIAVGKIFMAGGAVPVFYITVVGAVG